MVFREYEQHKTKLNNSIIKYEKLLDDRERLFNITQPKGINPSKEKIKSSVKESPYDVYLIEKEKRNLDDRIEEALKLIDKRKNLLENVKFKLLESDELIDEVYICRYMKRMKVRQISQKINYSEPQTYRMLSTIRKIIEDDRKW